MLPNIYNDQLSGATAEDFTFPISHPLAGFCAHCGVEDTHCGAWHPLCEQCALDHHQAMGSDDGRDSRYY